MRCDSRMQPLLIEMARLGRCRHDLFEEDDLEFISTWLEHHDLPGFENYLCSYTYDTVFPWDFIDYGVTKEHLWKRYQEALKEYPNEFPRCLEGCQGCGACTPEHQKEMAGYRRIKRIDTKLPLSDLIPHEDEIANTDNAASHNRYAVIAFTHDSMHRTVMGNYWEDELSRALNYAGIEHYRPSVRIFKPYRERNDFAIGKNYAVIIMNDQIDEEELIEAINAHTVNMTVTDVTWFSSKPALQSISYWIPLPGEIDKVKLGRKIDSILLGDVWNITIALHAHASDHLVRAEVRDEIFELAIRDNGLYMKIDPILSPYPVYQERLGIDWDKAGCHVAERITYEYVESANR